MDIEKLKAAALAATPGKWQVNSTTSLSGKSRITKITTEGNEGIRVTGLTLSSGEEAEANDAFIAAFNPATALELIAEIERLRGLKEDYKYVIKHQREKLSKQREKLSKLETVIPSDPAAESAARQAAQEPQPSGWNAAIEAAAKVCDDVVPKFEHFDDQRAAGNAARKCANEIRSLLRPAAQEAAPVTIEEGVRRANATLTAFEVATEKPKTTFPPDWSE